jgi:hypothetical protein
VQGFESEPVEAGLISEEYGPITTTTSFSAITNASSGLQAFFQVGCGVGERALTSAPALVPQHLTSQPVVRVQGGYSGIMGLAYRGIAEIYFHCHTQAPIKQAMPLLDALYADAKLPEDLFSLSFCGQKVGVPYGNDAHEPRAGLGPPVRLCLVRRCSTHTHTRTHRP